MAIRAGSMSHSFMSSEESRRIPILYKRRFKQYQVLLSHVELDWSERRAERNFKL